MLQDVRMRVANSKRIHNINTYKIAPPIHRDAVVISRRQTLHGLDYIGFHSYGTCLKTTQCHSSSLTRAGHPCALAGIILGYATVLL